VRRITNQTDMDLKVYEDEIARLRRLLANASLEHEKRDVMTKKMNDMKSNLVVPKFVRNAASKWKNKTFGLEAKNALRAEVAGQAHQLETSGQEVFHLRKVVRALEDANRHLQAENEDLRAKASQVRDVKEERMTAASPRARDSMAGKEHRQLKAAEARAEALQAKLDALEHVRATETKEHRQRIEALEARVTEADLTNHIQAEDNLELTKELDRDLMISHDPLGQAHRDSTIRSMVKDEMAGVFSRFDQQIRNSEEHLAREHVGKPLATWQYSSPHTKRLHRTPALEASTASQEFSSYMSPRRYRHRDPPENMEASLVLSPASKLGVFHLPSRS